MGIVRMLSAWLRRNSEQKMYAKTLSQFHEWKQQLDLLPPPSVAAQKRLALIRLDDIGDFILWHNFIPFYQSSTAYASYRVTLVGNVVWRSLFEHLYPNLLSAAIWVDKRQYFEDEAYRDQIWHSLRSAGFEMVICPSRTRPLLLDDLLCLATAAPIKIAAYNTLPSSSLNEASDVLYTQLFAKGLRGHEFHFNRTFTSFVCNVKSDLRFPSFPRESQLSLNHKQIICFIGASAKSKQWPIKYWIELIRLIGTTAYQPVLLGGKGEIKMADKIVQATGVVSFVGQTSLVDTLTTIATSRAVISGDTMAAHAAVAFQKPCVILANGVNAKRFVAYQEAGFQFVHTLYTQAYIDAQKPDHHLAVSSDMRSIKPTNVWQSMLDLLG